MSATSRSRIRTWIGATCFATLPAGLLILACGSWSPQTRLEQYGWLALAALLQTAAVGESVLAWRENDAIGKGFNVVIALIATISFLALSACLMLA